MRKRLLSLALAICMVAALLPATVVTAGAETISYQYAFNSKNTATNTAAAITTADFEYADTVLDADGNETYSPWGYLASYKVRANFPQTYISGSFSGLLVRTNATNISRFVIKLKVPTAGTYNVNLQYLGHPHSDTPINIYALPAGSSTPGSATALSDSNKLNANGALSLWAASATRDANVDLPGTITTTTDNEERIIVFELDSWPETPQDGGTAASYIYYGGLTLSREVQEVITYTVTYNANGGDTTPDAVTTEAGAITLPAAITKDGFTFKGWFDGTSTYAASASYTVSGDVTFTAVWEAVDGYTFVYDLNPENISSADAKTKFGTDGIDGTLDYAYASGMCEYAYDFGANSTYYSGVGLTVKSDAVGRWLAVKINVPVSGTYAMSLNHLTNKAGATGGKGDIYILPADTTYQEANELLLTDDKDAYKVNDDLIVYQDSSLEKNKQSDTPITNAKQLSAGEHIVVFYAAEKVGDVNPRMYPHTLTLTSGAVGGKKPAYVGYVDLADNSILIDGETTASAKVWNAVTGAEITTGTFSYTSDAEDIASVSGATVTGAKEGSTKIGATYTGDITAGSILEDDITVEYAEKLTAVGSFGVYQQGGDDADITVVNTDGTAFTNYDESEYVPGDIGTAALGKEVVVTAAEESVTGAKFAYWKRGKQVVSYSATITYKLNTNTALIAVYDNENAETKTVELWSANGALLETLTGDEITAEAVAAVQPTLTGYAFLNKWYVAEDEELDITNLTKAVTRAVAQHSEKGVAVGDKNYGDLEQYGEENGTATYWTRTIRGEEKVVAYGPTYDYYVWDATEVKSYTDEVEAKPVVVLDDYANDAYMIEYSVPSGYTKIEAGILYGFSGEPTIGAANSKAVSERSDRHGQLTAAPSSASERVVRGYLIYRDDSDSSRRVIYTDVVTIGE